MKINEYYKPYIGESKENFVEFIKNNNTEITEEDLDNIDHLAQRVAQNLFIYEDNLSTAKSDYISLLGILLKKGLIYKK